MSEHEKNGGPAFPHASIPRPELGEGFYQPITEGGMSMRDYFAGQAIPAARAIFEAREDEGPHPVPDDLRRHARHWRIASEAYAIADALLKARKGDPGNA